MNYTVARFFLMKKQKLLITIIGSFLIKKKAKRREKYFRGTGQEYFEIFGLPVVFLQNRV
jgi:hypothetical protein